MNGRILHVPDPAHTCKPPDIFQFAQNSAAGIPTVKYIYPPGSLWMCECGRVWVVRFTTTRKYRYGYQCGGSFWDQETRPEKRRRLGLKWWMRTPSHE